MKTNEQVLGVMVTSRTVHAVLVSGGPAGPRVLRRYVRQRNARFLSAQPAVGTMAEATEEGNANDFTISFGDGANQAGDMFLGSEFGPLDQNPHIDERNSSAAQPAPAGSSFAPELTDILEQCQEAGYVRPVVVFCAGSNDVTPYELQIIDKKNKKSTSAPTKEQLVSLLADQYGGDLDRERVSFVPLTPTEDGARRYLALIAKAGEPVGTTIEGMRQRRQERLPHVRLLDTEINVYLGLARTLLRQQGAAGSQTLVVRAGAEDTLVMFLRGEEVAHFDSMRSLTAFDSPETICSRVLLQQDEYGIEEVNNVLLLSEEREADLIESFGMFFPDAMVTSLRDALPASEDSEDRSELSFALVPTTGVAVRGLRSGNEGVFEDVNLLPHRLIRRQLTLPLTWPHLAMGLLLFITAFFFTARFAIYQNQINDTRERIRIAAPGGDIENVDARVLQARIDSMQAAHAGYTRALDVLDTLLLGTDQWSRTLDRLSREAASLRGLWVETLEPNAEGYILTGSATSRERAVALADRLGADIQALTFDEVREWPIYSYRMQIRVTPELPAAARYLREKETAQLAAAQSAPAAAPVAGSR